MANLQYTDDNWLGEVPAHWPIVPSRSLFSNPVERNRGDDIHLTPSQKFGVIPQSEYMEITGSRVVLNLSGADNMRHVEPGDYVSHLRSFQGGLEYSPYKGKVSSAYTVLRPKRQIEPRFYKYLFKSGRYVQGLATTTEQLRDGQSIRYQQFSLLPLPYPPIEEQKAIADFLDWELDVLDAGAAKQKALIDLLDELKRAVIKRSITLGLAGSTENWDRTRLRYLASVESGSDYKEIEVAEGGFPVYGSGGEFTRASKCMHSGESVLMGRKGTIDRPLYVNGSFWTVDTMFWTKFKSGVHVKFIYYWATTLPFNLFKTSTALPSMTGTDLKNMPIHLPPLPVQIQIANYLDEVTDSMTKLAEAAQAFLATTNERRQALINAAVTGKIEIQGMN